jgi:cysteinyl-tRNA synthetase
VGLTLYNTRTRTKEAFRPLDPGHVRMYVCGPTVYDFAHIGNARPIIVFDVLYRLLKYLAEKGEWDGQGQTRVTYARNITDVDDKINARAAEAYPDMPPEAAIRKLTEETTAQFHKDVAALGCLPPDFEPRATDFVEQMKAMIAALHDIGVAYAAEDHVLFSVAAYDKLADAPRYGSLARRSLDEMIAGARVEVAPYKRDAVDFVLWKPSKPGEPAWASPLGIAAPGRPGWHLECSAMSKAILGDEFDIHGGGIDLVFPHHENEVAQSCGANHTPIMANFWMHNGFLQVEGEKMSKSVGNFVTINQLLTDWHGYGWPGEAIRFNMLQTHYRQPTDWTFHNLDASHKTLWDWYGALEGGKPSKECPQEFLAMLSDDLNTPGAISVLHGLQSDRQISELLSALKLLGFSGSRENLRRRLTLSAETGVMTLQGSDAELRVESLIQTRLEARKAKNWAEADRIRDELAGMGITLKDAKNPQTGEIETTWEVAR